MARMNLDDYMFEVQDVVMKGINLHRLDTDEVMFRIVDATPLVPRHRVEVGVTYGGAPVLISTQRMKDPKLTGKALAGFINERLMKEEEDVA